MCSLKRVAGARKHAYGHALRVVLAPHQQQGQDNSESVLQYISRGSASFFACRDIDITASRYSAGMSGSPSNFDTGTTASESARHGGKVVVRWGDTGNMTFTIGQDYAHDEVSLMYAAAVELGHASIDDDEEAQDWGKKSAYVRVGDEYRLKKLRRIFEDIDAIVKGEARDIVEDGQVRVLKDKAVAGPDKAKKTRRQGTETQHVRLHFHSDQVCKQIGGILHSITAVDTH